MTNDRAISDAKRALVIYDIQEGLATRPPQEVGFVYLAGPYRGKDATAHDWTVYAEIDRHINNAREWAKQFATDGVPYVCPHMNSAHMEVLAPDAPPSYWLQADMAILCDAVVIFMLPGWRDSSGAKAELEFCQEQGIPSFTHEMYDTANGLLLWWADHLKPRLGGKDVSKYTRP